MGHCVHIVEVHFGVLEVRWKLPVCNLLLAHNDYAPFRRRNALVAPQRVRACRTSSRKASAAESSGACAQSAPSHSHRCAALTRATTPIAVLLRGNDSPRYRKLCRIFVGACPLVPPPCSYAKTLQAADYSQIMHVWRSIDRSPVPQGEHRQRFTSSCRSPIHGTLTQIRAARSKCGCLWWSTRRPRCRHHRQSPR